MNQPITRQLLPTEQRLDITAWLFGINFPIKIEPTIFQLASTLSPDYSGGYWQFYTLSNGGFYMAPDDHLFRVSCENGFEGILSAEAFGIVCCLYTYSGLSFGSDSLAETCAEHFHWLRAFALDHADAGAVFRAID